MDIECHPHNVYSHGRWLARMQGVQHRKLDTFSLAALLVSAHYGLGFILGTAEQALTVGVAGSLYAASLGIGTIVLLTLARLYWTETEQIWTLLGNQYGKTVKVLIGTMSWASLVGIAAVQLISGAFVLQVLHLPTVPSMVVLTLGAMVLSLLPTERASRIFQGLLLFNVLVLLVGLWRLHGFSTYLRSPIEFIPSLAQLQPGESIGISLSTILLVLIDMKYQQFVVQAKTIRSLYQGCLLAAIVLLMLAFLPSAVVTVALQAGILPDGIDGKSILPYFLAWLGGGITQPLGMLLVLSLIVPALGIGSSILRVQTKTILDLEIAPKTRYSQLLVTGGNAALGLIVALHGGSIIQLIVQFYAMYVAAVCVPFAGYLLVRRGYSISATSIKFSLMMSSASALATLILIFIFPTITLFGSAELSILFTGGWFGLLGLLIGQLVNKYLPSIDISKMSEKS